MQLPNEFTLKMLKDRRRSHGFPSQKSVADYIGVHRNTIYAIESKGIWPEGKPDLMVKLQFVYGLTIEQMAFIEKNRHQVVHLKNGVNGQRSRNLDPRDGRTPD